MVTRLPCVVTELSIVKKKRKKFIGIPFSFLIWLTVHLTAFSADESSAAPYFAKSAVYGVRSSSQSMDISSDSDSYDRTPDHRSRRREAHRRPGRDRARGNGREIDGRTVDISEKISTLANTLQVLCAGLRQKTCYVDLFRVHLQAFTCVCPQPYDQVRCWEITNHLGISFISSWAGNTLNNGLLAFFRQIFSIRLFSYCI